jgi:predicted metalloprotease with PDZ domain
MLGYAESPYTPSDLKSTLAAVSGDPAFASEFFARYIEGRDVVDYAPLLARAGLLMRKTSPGRATAGPLRMQDSARGVRLVAATMAGSPAYEAGLDRDDVITSVAGTRATTADAVDRAIAARRPGDSLPLTFERRGQQVSATIRLIEDPTVEIVPVEQAGQSLNSAQQRFRDLWLSPGARNAF